MIEKLSKARLLKVNKLRKAARPVLAAGAILIPAGASVPSAVASTAPNGGVAIPDKGPNAGGAKAPEYTGAPSEKQLALNDKAQKYMDLLARRIVRGAVNNHGKSGIEYIWDSEGIAAARSTVVVGAKSHYTGMPAAYKFDVISDVSSSGEPVLEDVQQVNVTLGETATDDTKSIAAPYTSLTLIRNNDTDSIAFGGTYLDTKASSFNSIEAAVIPSVADEAKLNNEKFSGVTTQFSFVLKQAINGLVDVRPLGRAFRQPEDTIPQPLK